MQKKTKKQPLRRKIIFYAILTFFVSYLASLVLWIQVKDYYGKAVTSAASNLVTVIKDVKFEGLSEDKNLIQATFNPSRYGEEILIDIPVKTSSYTFNAPLTFAIMAALYLFITRRKRAYAEALLILLAIHLLYVFSFQANELTRVMIDRGLEVASWPRVIPYQFLWSFTDNMVIRFEPFLIGFYMFMRFRSVENRG